MEIKRKPVVFNVLPQQLKEIHQELQGGESRPLALRGNMSIFLIRYVSKSYGHRLGAPRRIYEYIPY